VIELLSGLKTSTLSQKQLQGIAFELAGGELSNRRILDREILERICEHYKISASLGQSSEEIARAVCFGFDLTFNAEKDIKAKSQRDTQFSEVFWRKIIRSMRGIPWVFLCSYAENQESAVHGDVFGITYGFHEDVNTWRGLVASGSGALVVIYNTINAPTSKMTYSSIARIDEIIESKEIDYKGRRQWKVKLADFHMLSPVPRNMIEIERRNPQYGIQEITFDTFSRIVELGKGTSYLHVAEVNNHEVQSAAEISVNLSGVLGHGRLLDEVIPDPAVTAPRALDESMSEKEFSADQALASFRKSSRKLDKQTETQAVEIVLAFLNGQGWELLHDNQLDGIGYDFEFVKDGQSLLIEIKGIRGSKLEFNMTAREFFVCSKKENFRLIAVTNVLNEIDYKIHVLCPSDVFQMKRRITQYRLSSVSAIG
jgi:hypothetical protein